MPTAYVQGPWTDCHGATCLHISVWDIDFGGKEMLLVSGWTLTPPIYQPWEGA